MDMTDSIAPKSDQLNYEDFLDGPKTVTITKVTKGSAEQPYSFHLAESDRPFKPSKTVRRIIVACWGKETETYVGRRMTLFGDPSVKWAGQEVGGIRVSHLSNIDKRQTLTLSVTKGQRRPHVIEPLRDAPTPAPTVQPVTDDTLAELDQLFTEANIADDQRLPGVAHIIGAQVTALDTLTEPQAQQVVAALRNKVGR